MATPTFDPNAPFEVLDEPTPAFDPSAPFEVLEPPKPPRPEPETALRAFVADGRPSTEVSVHANVPRGVEPRPRSTEQLIETIATPKPVETENDRLRREMDRLQQEQLRTNPDVRTVTSIGTEKRVPDVLPFVGQGLRVADAVSVYRAAKRYEKEPNPQDEQTLVDFHNRQVELQSPHSLGYAVGNILANLPAFAAELAYTSGAFRGVTKATHAALLRASSKAVNRAAQNAVTQAAARVAATTAGSIAQAPLARGGEMAAQTIENMTPGIRVAATDQGPKVELTEGADPFAKAAVKAFGDQLIEIFTEHSGRAFGAAAGKIPGVNQMRALKTAAINRYLLRHPNETVQSALKKIRTETDWNGVFAEMFEERLGEGLRAATGLEEYKPPTVQQLLAEGLAFAVPGGGALAIQAGAGQINAGRIERAENRLRKAQSSLDYARDLAQGQQNLIDAERRRQAAGKEANAQGIRSDTQQPGTPGPTAQGGQTDRRGNVQQAPPEQPQPVAAREEAAVPAPATKGVATFAGYMGEPGSAIPLVNIPGGFRGRLNTVSPEAAQQQGYTLPPIPPEAEWRATQAGAQQAPAKALPKEVAVVLPDGRAFFGGTFHADLMTDLVRNGTVLPEDMEKAQSVFMDATGVMTDAEGKKIPYRILSRRTPQAISEQGGAEFTPPAVEPVLDPQTGLYTYPSAPESPEDLQAQLAAEVPAEPATAPRAQTGGDLSERPQGQEKERLQVAQPAPVTEAAAGAPTPAPSELDTLTARRAEILAKIAADPMTRLHPDTLQELVTIASRIHELDPERSLRGEPAPAPQEEAPNIADQVRARLQSESQGDVPSNAPIKLQHQTVFDAARKRVRSILRKLGVKTITIVPTNTITHANAAATIGENGEIIIFQDAMDASLNGLPVTKRQRWLEAVLVEEAIHTFVAKDLSQAEIESVWNALSDADKRELVESYARGVDPTQLTPYQLGHEYLRQFLQRRIFGTRTESVRPESTIFDRISDALRAVIERILTAFNALRAAGLPHQVDDAITKLAEAYKSGNLGDIIPTPNVTARQRPTPPASLMSTTAQRLQEHVAGGRVTQSQANTINYSAMVQNHAVVGHLSQAWNNLRAEVKAHLDFVRARIAALGSARAALGHTQPIGDLATLVNNSPEPELASVVMADAWENIHELRLQRLDLEQQMDGLIRELEQLRARGTSISQHGIVATNLRKALIRDAINHVLAQLTMQQQQLIAASADPSRVGAMIRYLRQWLSSMTVPLRVLAAIDNSQRSGQPITNDTWQQMGVDPSHGNTLARILSLYPRLAQRLAQINGTAPSPEEQALLTQIAERQEALQWLDREVFGAQEFRTNEKQAVDELRVEDEVTLDELTGDAITHRTFELPSGEKVRVGFQLDKPTSDANAQALLRVLTEYRNYIDPVLNPNPLPSRVRAYERQIYNIENFYLNPSFNPGAEESGKLRPTAGNVFNWFTFGGFFGTPQSVAESIGGLPAAVANNALQHLSDAQQMVQQAHYEMAAAMNVFVNQAWRAHRKLGDGIRSRDQWEREISDPVFAYSQELGGPRLAAGSKFRGRTITAADMRAIEAQKQYVDTISATARAERTEQGVLRPLKIHVGDALPYYRDPQHRGPLTMPRYERTEAAHRAQAFKEIKDRKLTPSQERAELLALLAGDRSPAFVDTVEGHLRGASHIPSAAAFIDSPFQVAYRAILDMIDSGDPTQPRTITEVIDYIFANQTVKPENLLSPQEITDQLLGEIWKSLSNAQAAETSTKPENVAHAGVDITSADNFFTKPRGRQVLPPTLLSYSVTSQSTQNRIKSAVWEVLGQRWLEALDALYAEIERQQDAFEDRVEALMGQGRTELSATRQVKRESREEQRAGLNWLTYGELSYHRRRVLRQINYLRGFANAKRAWDEENVGTITQMFRKSIIGPILQAVGVVFRNRIGGTVRMMIEDYVMSSAARMGPKNSRLYLPQGKLITTPIREYSRLAVDLLKGGVLVPFLAHKAFDTARGRRIRATLTSNPQFWGKFMGQVLGMLNRQAERYDKMHELGITDGRGSIMKQLHAYMLLVTEGGVPRDETPSVTRKMLRTFESAIGVAAETGVITFPLIAPRSLISRMADLGINATVMKFVNEKLDSLMANALFAVGNRRNAGDLTPSSQLQFTPQEMLGNPLASKKQAEYLRMLFRRAGINLDKVMADYWDKVQAAQAAGQTLDDVDFLTDTQWNSIYMVMANQINKAALTNRPQVLTSTEWGRTFGALLGWGFGFNASLALNYEQHSRSKDRANIEGIANTAAALLFILMTGGAGEEIVRLLHWLFYHEERQTPRLSEAETVGEAIMTVAKNSGPFYPMVAGVFNTLLEPVRGGQGLGGSGFQFLPVSVFNSVMQTATAAVQTGSITRPAIHFVRQWQPNSKILLNRLSINEGLVNYYNVNRSLRSAAPDTMEPQRNVGGVYRRSPVSDNRDNVVNALAKEGGPDWETALRERELGIAELASRGAKDPERSFDAGVAAKMPTRVVFGRPISPGEREQLLSRMTPDQVERLTQVESALSSYSARTSRRGAGSRLAGRVAGSRTLRPRPFAARPFRTTRLGPRRGRRGRFGRRIGTRRRRGLRSRSLRRSLRI